MILCMFKKAGKCDLPKNKANIDIFKHNRKVLSKLSSMVGKPNVFSTFIWGVPLTSLTKAQEVLIHFYSSHIEMPFYVKYHFNF